MTSKTQAFTIAFEEGDSYGPPMLIWWPGWGLDLERIKADIPAILCDGDCEDFVERLEENLWEDGELGEDEHLTPEQVLERWPHTEPREGWMGICDEPDGGWICDHTYQSEEPTDLDYTWSKATIVEYDWRRA